MIGQTPRAAGDISPADILAHLARQRRFMAELFQASPPRTAVRREAAARELALQDAAIALVQRQVAVPAGGQP